MEIPGIAGLGGVLSGLGSVWSLPLAGRQVCSLDRSPVHRSALGQFNVFNQSNRFPRQHTENI